MTWTSAFGRACAVLLRTIVRWLALTRINPNVLTFMGLVVNTWAAFLFGYATAQNQQRMFFYAGLVIIGSGFFDLVDGEVARATNRVTRFGAFFDSVMDRYSDASQFFGLLVFYARGDRFFYVVLTAYVIVSAIMVSYSCQRDHGELQPGAGGVADRLVPRRLHGTSGAPGAGDHRSIVQSHGSSSVDHRSAVDDNCDPPNPIHLGEDERRGTGQRSGSLAGGSCGSDTLVRRL